MGKIIIITGASRGIGKYLYENWSLKDFCIGTYNSTIPGFLNSKLPGLKKVYKKVNLLNTSEIEELIDSSCYSKHATCTETSLVLINCAGINYNSFAHKADRRRWKEVIDVNLTGTFNIISQILPIMRDKEWGRIINLSSVVAQMGVPGTSAYAASKAGLYGMTKAIAVENANKGITINNINLGYFDIGMIKEVPEKYQALLKEKIPTGKFGDPKNILNAVKFLIENDYINGTSIDINAGLF